MSVKEARKLLGKTASNMTDEEIAKVVDNLDEIAKYMLQKLSTERTDIKASQNA
jgi:hypothetical protein